MGNLLLKKKKTVKLMRKAKTELAALGEVGLQTSNKAKKLNDKIEVYGTDIKKFQKEAKELLKAEKEYMANSKPQCVYTYI